MFWRIPDALSFVDEARVECAGLLFKCRDQHVSGKYGGWSDERLPGPSEVYQASFGVAVPGRLRGAVEVELGEKVGRLVGRKVRSIDLRVHRLVGGDFFRAHKDNEVGSYGFTVQLTKRWKLDWGGLLVVVEEEPVVCLPKYNELVVIDSETPHFVTEVSPHALEHRLTLVGFVKCG
jgi:Rps23 Pro-64 3,4-dihydroxylase Tpa1-like proline 4-hydroxylase